jgi:hypothetical protein
MRDAYVKPEGVRMEASLARVAIVTKVVDT